MKKILISDKLADAGINYLNGQQGIQIHFERLGELLLQQVADISAVTAAYQIEI